MTESKPKPIRGNRASKAKSAKKPLKQKPPRPKPANRKQTGAQREVAGGVVRSKRSQADFAHVGAGLLGFEGLDEEGIQRRTKEMLFRVLNSGRLMAFVGSGVSQAYGYPGWDKLTKSIVKDVLKRASKTKDERSLEHLRAFASKDGSKDSILSRGDSSLLAMDACENLLGPQQEDLKEIAIECLHADRPFINYGDPVGKLIDHLKIQRFLTTNYDTQIEESLSSCLRRMSGSQKRTNSKVLGVPSLSSCPERYEELVKFAVRDPGFKSGVFHCHGIESEPKSIVVSERDYQNLYLKDDATHRVYRGAVSLAFAGNPVLFVGLGMEEADLLRPLRQFVTETDQQASHGRPLFALVHNMGDRSKAFEFQRFLYRRYGVKVIFWGTGEEEETQDLTTALIQEIESLGRQWRQWWMEWQRIPPVRRAYFGVRDTGADSYPRRKVMVHHWIDYDVGNDEPQDLERIVAAVDEKPSVLVLGRPGTGKGFLGFRLAEGRGPKRITRAFYASTHFTNDFLSLLDSASEFLLDDQAPESDTYRKLDPVKRFEKALEVEGCMIVIGGVERLLRPPSPAEGMLPAFADDEGHPPVPAGLPINREVERFFELVAEHAKNQAGAGTRLVLMSSVQPMIAQNDSERAAEIRELSEDVAKLHLKGLTKNQLHRLAGMSELRRDLLNNFHKALHGHAYALSVADLALQGIEGVEERESWLASLVSHLTSFGISQRAEIVISAAVKEAYSTRPDLESTVRNVLRCIALCAIPVTVECIRVMLATRDEKELRAALELLTERGLLLTIAHEKGKASFKRYTAHGVVRLFILHSLGSQPEISSEPQRFGLGGHLKENEVAHVGGHESIRRSAKFLDRLLTHLEEHTSEVSDHCDSESIDDEFRQWRTLVRTAFGLIRSRWSATAVARISDSDQGRHSIVQSPAYDSYQRRLARLVNIMRHQLHDSLWFDEEEDGRTSYTSKLGPLYADEISWIYNELALVAYSKGILPDAYALYRVGQDLNLVGERGCRGHRWCHSELSLGKVQIERARLPRAKAHLENACRVAVGLGDEGILGRVIAYQGLVAHLSGDYDLADVLYKRALSMLKHSQNNRGVSVVCRHHGDLLRVRDQRQEAGELLKESIMAAERGGHEDLLWYSRVAEANLHRASGDLKAGNALEAALAFAKTVGMPKLEADTYKVQAHLALHHGEMESAARLAARCLRIGSSLGMRLRVTSALVLMGHVASRKGQFTSAKQMFESAVRMGGRQGYQLKVEESAREILRLDADN